MIGWHETGGTGEFVTKDPKLFSVGDFAKISRTTIATLHHYDKVGLFSPIGRGANKFRYYSIRQLADINVISTLRKLGLPLAKIKVLRDRRTPELAKEMLTRQTDEINTKIDELVQAWKLLSALRTSIQTGLDADKETITVQFLPSEPISLGEPNDYRGGRNDYDALFSFYRAMHDRYSDSDLNYPVWAVFSEERIRRGDWTWPDRYCFYHPDGRDQKPAALYATGYMHTGYGQGDQLYKRLVDYIDRNGFEICGDTYEEYPLNEICVADDTDYLMRVMITVREKKHGQSEGQ
jgi:DNA-binding transcriptional MerR regulator